MYMYMYLYICMYVHIRIHKHIRTYTCIYIHHISTPANESYCSENPHEQARYANGFRSS